MTAQARPVRLCIASDMCSPDGERMTDRRVHHGTLEETDAGMSLIYDEELDGERSRVTLSMAPKHAQMRRSGMTNACLTFVPGERCAGLYATTVGEIPIEIDTRRVERAQTETGGTLTLEYDVYIAGECTSSTELCATWRF